MLNLTGHFQIQDWKETVQSEYDYSKRSLANVKLKYSGDIVGNSELQYLLHYQADGSAEFVGYENIQAEVNGVAGFMVLRHTGTFSQGVASSQFTVTACDIDDKLVALKGVFKSGVDGQAEYTIHFT